MESDQSQDQKYRTKFLTFSGILFGMVSSVLMQSILSTVLPDVTKEMGGQEWYSWVFTGYMITSTLTIPVFSRLTDRYGRKSFYLGGLVLFLIGTLLCGSAESIPSLVFYRLIQGIGAGALAPAAIAMTSDLFPVEERGKMMGILTGVQVLANILGPLMGGWITDHFGWQWSFYSILPFGVFAFFLVFVGIRPDVQKEPEGKLAPVPSLLKNRNAVLSVGSFFVLGSLMYGVFMVLPLYGFLLFGTTLAGGTLLLPFTLAVGTGGIVAGKGMKRFCYATITVGSWFLAVIGFALLAVYSRISPSYTFLSLFTFVSGLGVGMLMPTLMGISQNAVLPSQRATMGGMVQIGRNIGGVVGIPIFTAILDTPEKNGFMVSSFFFVFIVFALLAGIGTLIGTKIKGSVLVDAERERNQHV